MNNDALPAPKSRRHQLMMVIKDKGPMDAQSVMLTDTNWYGFQNPRYCKKELREMVLRGTLVCVGEIFALGGYGINDTSMSQSLKWRGVRK
jgi:hypothetical protein